MKTSPENFQAQKDFVKAFTGLMKTYPRDPLMQALALLAIATTPDDVQDQKFTEELANPILDALLKQEILEDPFWKQKLFHLIMAIEYAAHETAPATPGL